MWLLFHSQWYHCLLRMLSPALMMSLYLHSMGTLRLLSCGAQITELPVLRTEHHQTAAPLSSRNRSTQPRQGTGEEDNWPLAPQRNSLQRLFPCPLNYLCVPSSVCLTCEIGLDLRKYFSSVVLLKLISASVYLCIGGFHLSSCTNWVLIAHRPLFFTIVKEKWLTNLAKMSSVSISISTCKCSIELII